MVTEDVKIAHWLNLLDCIDPFFGDKSAINSLISTAPTPELSAWLTNRAAENEVFANTILLRDRH